MREMEQNDVYDESEFAEGEDLDAEGAEDVSSGISTIYGIPKNIFFIGVAIVFVLIVLLIVIALWRNKAKNNVVPPTDYTVQQPVTDVPTVQETLCFVDSIYVGYISGGVYTGASILDDTGNFIYTLEATGNAVVKDELGNTLGYVNKTVTESDVPVASDTSGYDTKLLRKHGYTGDEIQLAMQNGISEETLLEKAKELEDEAAKEALVRMSDSASEEFQLLVNTTQYCMPYQEFQPLPAFQEGYFNEHKSYIVNADYEKIPTYGMQLRIKVKIANNIYVFMDITPDRYTKLPDSGNIVVQVDYVLYGLEDQFSQFYIVGLTEKDITTLTVNPQDSGVDINDIISN